MKLGWLSTLLQRIVIWLRGVPDDDCTCYEVGRRGSCVIVRNKNTLMFDVVDMAGRNGPEFVNDYAIYSNAVLGALAWNHRKSKNNGLSETEHRGTITR